MGKWENGKKKKKCFLSDSYLLCNYNKRYTDLIKGKKNRQNNY